MRDPFALPPVATKTTKVITAAADYIRERRRMESDARDIIKGLVEHHGATITHPTYRTALRCGDIYSEAATSCGLSTARLLLDSFTDKARRYLESGGGDLFSRADESQIPDHHK